MISSVAAAGSESPGLGLGSTDVPSAAPATHAVLLEHLRTLLAAICVAFFQERTGLRAMRLALGHIVTLGHRMLSRIITCSGRDQVDWSADYLLFSRARWSARQLMMPVLQQAVWLNFGPNSAQHAEQSAQATSEPSMQDMQDLRPVWVAGDHTHITRCGRHVAGIQTIRDPMSPAYHVNLIKGLRFFHLSVLCSPWREQGLAHVPARALPVRFEPSETLRRPGKKATQEDWKAYRCAVKAKHSTVQALEQILELRADLDACGAAQRPLFVALDGAFSNRTFYGKRLERIELISRLRRDAKLCFAEPAPAQGKKARRFFAEQKFTPEQVLKDESIPWQRVTVRTGGREHEVRCKEVRHVYWQRGGGRQEVRLLVLAPTGYRLSKHSKLLYRAPAFLVTTSQSMSVEELVQGYVDRWQIEVAHRELKDSFGLEDSQVRHKCSVPRHAAFAVAVYSVVHLAALKAFGPTRTGDYIALPKWHRGAVRPSLVDILRLIRKGVLKEKPEWVGDLKITGDPDEDEPTASSARGYSAQTLVTKAAA